MPHFTASDGVRISYDDEGAGRPVVLLHGLMAHRGFFERQRSLAADFRLINVDLRGHGESPSRHGLTIAQLADDVAALVAQLDLHDAIGVGWSLGASVLWELLTGPATTRFAGVVIIDMTPCVRNDDDWQLGLASETCEARRHAIEEDYESFAAAAGQAIFAQPVAEHRQGDAAWASAQFVRNDPLAVSALWSSLVEQDFRPMLGRIRQPTLIVHGVRSHLYGSDTAHHLAASIPDATSVAFAQSGHSPHLEQPEYFNSILKDFAARLPAAREPHTA